jgi:GNAT superfamily N-acetyltransferase
VDARRAARLGEGMVQVVEVDPHEEPFLRAWWEADHEANRADRPDALLRTWEAHRAVAQNPSPYRSRRLLAVVADDRVVGTAELDLWHQSNEHLCSVEVAVLPGHRRRGIGRALFDEADRRRRADARTTVIGEVSVPSGLALDEVAGGRFAHAMGMRSVHQEDHLVLRLPVSDEHLGRLRAAVGERGSAYDVVTWGNRCPDEYVDAFCTMNTQMAADVPSGGLDLEAVVYDEARLRTDEERTSAAYDQVVAAARRRSDGVFGGFSQLFLAKGAEHVQQDDTLVMPEHRGARLGTLLKLATLDVVRRDHPERRALHTWTEPDNHAMHRTNTDFGYRPVERMHEMQLRDGDGGVGRR